VQQQQQTDNGGLRNHHSKPGLIREKGFGREKVKETLGVGQRRTPTELRFRDSRNNDALTMSAGFTLLIGFLSIVVRLAGQLY